MKYGFGKPLIVWTWQLGAAIRYDEIRSVWAVTHSASLFLPFVNIVFTFTRSLPR